MKVSHTIDQIELYSKEFDIFPLSTQIFSDNITPIQALSILKDTNTPCFLLESAESQAGRYTFLGFKPTLEISCLDGVTKISKNGITSTFMDNNPNKHIQNIIDSYKSVKLEDLPPFTGGLVGYFAYDYAKYSEPTLVNILKKEKGIDQDQHFRDMDLMLFDKVIAFDNYKHTITIIANISLSDLEKSHHEGLNSLHYIANMLLNVKLVESKESYLKSDFDQLFTQEDFEKIVQKTKEYIYAGDIFQGVLSNIFWADFHGSLLNTYRVLRTINPSPYMFYFSGTHLEIAGASPETLVKLENGKLSTFPLAGTRPRGKTREEDLALEKELLADEKEISEHNMLVDLGRNDLGKISRFGSVKVDKYMEILRFSHVMHIGSTVTSEILPNKTGLDAINAVLPAGTLSGAPKLRAMEIISELEKDKRGIYGGAVGYIDFTGNMDTCIAIRIAYKRGNKVYIRSGAGVVAGSDPASEYQECINKAKGMKVALERSGEL